MTIQFVHTGQIMYATVTLFTDAVKSTVLVVPQKIIQGFANLNFFVDIEGEWRTNIEFEEKYPSTVSSIKSAVFYDC